MDLRRVRKLNKALPCSGSVVYWMLRDHRVNDNWALLFAQELASKQNSSVETVFSFEAVVVNERQKAFMIAGLQEFAASAKKLGIQLRLFTSTASMTRYFKGKGAVVADFNPLTTAIAVKVAKNLKIPFYEVDAHNIVPCWIASQKQEFAAYTFRPKISKLLPQFLKDFPKIRKQKGAPKLPSFPKTKATLCFVPGEAAARKQLKLFIRNKLKKYQANSGNPVMDGLSNLSPYLHFGHISAERVALEVKKAPVTSFGKKTFLEELIVRKELSDNYCFYNKNFSSTKGFPEWAQNTLKKHRKNKREYCYSLRVLEKGKTHDALWNAAQKELLSKGKMHGYLRMYWAKKILEWTKTPEDAFKVALMLNDRYELDGNDPNGVVGVAWSIGGVHDRPWPERRVFGKIRYMNYNGCKRKFDVSKYVTHVAKF